MSFRDFHDTSRIMSRVGHLKNTPYFVDRDYPNEIVDARKRLWGKYKAAKAESRQSGANVKLIYPAKLLINGEVVHDEFPNWYEIMRGTRDRSFRHVHYDKPVSSAESRSSTLNSVPANSDASRHGSQISPEYAPTTSMRAVRPDVAYSSVVQSRPEAPTTAQSTVHHDNTHHSTVFPAVCPPPINTTGNYMQVSRDIDHIQSESGTMPITQGTSDTAPTRTQTEALQLTTPKVATERMRTPISSKYASPIVQQPSIFRSSAPSNVPIAAASSEVLQPSRPKDVPLIVQQPSIFRSSAPSNVPTAAISSEALQPGRPKDVPPVRNTRNSREQTRRARSPKRKTDNRSQSSARATRGQTRPSNRAQRSDSFDMRRNIDSDCSSEESDS
ncbi:MAG: hypothetical protein ABW185_10750 [Sedimenticola sp.]